MKETGIEKIKNTLKAFLALAMVMSLCTAVAGCSIGGDSGSSSERSSKKDKDKDEDEDEDEDKKSSKKNKDEDEDEDEDEDAKKGASKSGKGKKSGANEYAIGDTWTVDGQWELTITGVTETDERNDYSDENPEAVYIVDYTYTNIGYDDEDGIWDGLYITIDDTIVDSTGMMGYSYSLYTGKYPQETPIGATCKAQAVIGVDNAGDFTLNVSEYDSESNNQKAVFRIEVE